MKTTKLRELINQVMATTEGATPTPWRCCDNGMASTYISSGKGDDSHTVAECRINKFARTYSESIVSMRRAEVNARLIVNAVNNYKTLLEVAWHLQSIIALNEETDGDGIGKEDWKAAKKALGKLSYD